MNSKETSFLTILGENQERFIYYVIIIDTTGTTRYLVVLTKEDGLTLKDVKPERKGTGWWRGDLRLLGVR